MRLGCFVDRSVGDPGHLHPLAEIVNDLVIAIGGGLIIRFAAKREVPIGGSIESRLEPDWKSEPLYDGKPRPNAFKMLYNDHRQPSACLPKLDHGPDYIAEAVNPDAATADPSAA